MESVVPTDDEFYRFAQHDALSWRQDTKRRILEMIMRKPFLAGNWKMNMDAASAVALAKGVVAEVGQVDSVDIAVCPPFVYLQSVRRPEFVQRSAGCPGCLSSDQRCLYRRNQLCDAQRRELFVCDYRALGTPACHR
jgi:hypothetical protein